MMLPFIVDAVVGTILALMSLYTLMGIDGVALLVVSLSAAKHSIPLLLSSRLPSHRYLDPGTGLASTTVFPQVSLSSTSPVSSPIVIVPSSTLLYVPPTSTFFVRAGDYIQDLAVYDLLQKRSLARTMAKVMATTSRRIHPSVYTWFNWVKVSRSDKKGRWGLKMLGTSSKGPVGARRSLVHSSVVIVLHVVGLLVVYFVSELHFEAIVACSARNDRCCRRHALDSHEDIEEIVQVEETLLWRRLSVFRQAKFENGTVKAWVVFAVQEKIKVGQKIEKREVVNRQVLLLFEYSDEPPSAISDMAQLPLSMTPCSPVLRLALPRVLSFPLVSFPMNALFVFGEFILATWETYSVQEQVFIRQYCDDYGMVYEETVWVDTFIKVKHILRIQDVMSIQEVSVIEGATVSVETVPAEEYPPVFDNVSAPPPTHGSLEDVDRFASPLCSSLVAINDFLASWETISVKKYVKTKNFTRIDTSGDPPLVLFLREFVHILVVVKKKQVLTIDTSIHIQETVTTRKSIISRKTRLMNISPVDDGDMG